MRIQRGKQSGKIRLVSRETMPDGRPRPNWPELKDHEMCRFEYGIRCNAPAVWSDSPKGEVKYCRYHSDPRNRGFGHEQRDYLQSTCSWEFAEREILELMVGSASFACYQLMKERYDEWRRKPDESQEAFVARHRAIQRGMQGLKEVPK